MDALDEALPRSTLISVLTSKVCRILKTARAQIFWPKSKSSRLQVPELFNAIGISASLETLNLVLPATTTGDLNATSSIIEATIWRHVSRRLYPRLLK
jgi:hypothetical protein